MRKIVIGVLLLMLLTISPFPPYNMKMISVYICVYEKSSVWVKEKKKSMG